MRTTDMIIAGLFSPTAVAAVGLADVYGRVLNRGGVWDRRRNDRARESGHGQRGVEEPQRGSHSGSVAGHSGRTPVHDLRARFNEAAIALLGADRDVVVMGGQYLAIIMIVAPAIHITFVGAKAIQGVGDTRTPMYINGVANLTNIVSTVVLAFGLWGAPELSVIGIALGTAIGETVAALLFLLSIYAPGNDLRFVRPTDWTITKQLVQISMPRFAEGMSEMAAEFPLNAILLVFGTEANAAYHLGRRLYQQVVGPLANGVATAANILVGQSLGRAEPREAYVNGGATAALGVCTVAPLSAVLFVGAESFVRIFTSDPVTIAYAAGFGRAFAVAAMFIVAFEVLAGSLRDGSETRGPFFATVIGTLVFLLGLSYVGGIVLGSGILAVYLAIFADYAWRATFVGAVFYRRNWVAYGTALMADRGSIAAEPVDEG